MAKKSVGLIGLGNAGGPLGERLLAKGYVPTVYDTKAEVIESLAKLGARAATTPAGTVSDITFMAVPGTIEAVQAVLGPDGVLAAMRPGQVLIDLSGTDPNCARELQAKVQEKGGRFLGCTLHAAAAPAVTIPKGLLTIVVGGDQDTFNDCLEVLKALAQKVIYVPQAHTPKAIKIAVIMLTTANEIMLAEICSWLEAQDVDPRLFLKVQQLKGSDAGGRIERFFKRKKSYGGLLSNTYKDLRQALRLPSEIGVSLPMPFTSTAHQIQEMAYRQGFNRLDASDAFGRLYEMLTGFSLDRATVEKNERSFPEPHEPEVIYL